MLIFWVAFTIAVSLFIVGWALLIWEVGMEDGPLPEWPKVEPGDSPRHVRLIYGKLGPVDWQADPDYEYLADDPDAA